MLVLEKPQRLYGADVHENCEEPHSPRGCEHPNTEPLGVTSASYFLGFHDIPNSSNSLPLQKSTYALDRCFSSLNVYVNAEAPVQT